MSELLRNLKLARVHVGIEKFIPAATGGYLIPIYQVIDAAIAALGTPDGPCPHCEWTLLKACAQHESGQDEGGV